VACNIYMSERNFLISSYISNTKFNLNPPNVSGSGTYGKTDVSLNLPSERQCNWVLWILIRTCKWKKNGRFCEYCARDKSRKHDTCYVSLTVSCLLPRPLSRSTLSACCGWRCYGLLRSLKRSDGLHHGATELPPIATSTEPRILLFT
jgi:hypothetical protein